MKHQFETGHVMAGRWIECIFCGKQIWKNRVDEKIPQYAETCFKSDQVYLSKKELKKKVDEDCPLFLD